MSRYSSEGPEVVVIVVVIVVIIAEADAEGNEGEVRAASTEGLPPHPTPEAERWRVVLIIITASPPSSEGETLAAREQPFNGAAPEATKVAVAVATADANAPMPWG
jgi:hypothetical protein